MLGLIWASRKGAVFVGGVKKVQFSVGGGGGLYVLCVVNCGLQNCPFIFIGSGAGAA